MCAVDADNDAVGATITLAEFSSLPYLATSCGHQVSPLEAQLGVARRTEVTTAFGLAPVLLSGSNMVALIHARLARQLAARTNLRLLEPPMPLQPIHQLLLWPASVEHDPAHRWLRGRILALAAQLEADPARPQA